MQFFADAPTRSVTVLAQDPGILHKGKAVTTRVAIPNESLAPGPRGHRFHVVDYDASSNAFVPPSTVDPAGDRYGDETDIERLVADPHFHAQNAFAIASTTLLRFEAALGRHVNWGFSSGSHQLKIAPHAFAEANAFYSRDDEVLAFGYFPKAEKRGRSKARPADFVYTCLSFDIVAHETTHAILDGLRSEFLRPSSPDQAALHEGLADIVALLSGFSAKELLDHVLPAASRSKGRLLERSLLEPKALRKSVLLGLAVEMGAALDGVSVTEVRGAALRRSVEIKPTGSNYQDLGEDAEEHDLGELLVAATLNAFLEVWGARTKALDPMRTGFVDRPLAVAEGAAAAEHLLRMTIRAIDYLPPINVSFPDFLNAMITADHEAVPDDSRFGYRDILLEAFQAYGIRPVPSRQRGTASAKHKGLWDPPEHELAYGFDGHAEMQWDREAVNRFLWENREALKLMTGAYTIIVSVRPALRVGPGGFNLRETVAEYLQLLDVEARELASLGLRMPEDMEPWQRLRLQGGGALIFGDYGRLKYHIGTGVRSHRQNARLQYLWDRGAIGSAVRPQRSFAALHRERALRPAGNPRERW